MLRIEPRDKPSGLIFFLTPVLAILLTLIAGALLFAVMGKPPGRSLYAFFIEPIVTLYGLGELGVKAAPLILIALGLSFGFKAGIWNIGAEGQFTLGAISAGGIALALYEVEAPWVLPLMAFAGMAGGMAWAAIPAVLKNRYQASEILTSLMLTYIALLLLSYLVTGPWRDPDGYNFPESRLFADSAMLTPLLEGTRLHVGVIIALMVAVVAWIIFGKTLVGFQVKVAGLAPDAASYAGFSQKHLVWWSFLIAGGLAGLAGMLEVAGPVGQLLSVISPGYGFTAIIVAFLGRLHPLGIVLAGLVIALSYLGGENVQITLGLPLAVAGVFQGLLLFFLLATDFLVSYRVRFWRPNSH
ncbi:MAG: ABC transporter permease [Thiotrichales bacterium]